MTSFEFELWIEQYKAIIKEKGERALYTDEIQILDDNIKDIPEKYKADFDLAKSGDFGKFEKLPHLLRNYLGALELKEFRKQFGENPSLLREDVREYLEKNAMNAALRAGISAEKNAIPRANFSTEAETEKTREYAKALDSHMNHILMKRTMMPPSEQANKNLTDTYGQDNLGAELEKNMAKQLVMAKAMLLAQIGKYEVIDKNRTSKELDVPVYETFVHGNRTNFVLPVGVESRYVLDAFMGEKSVAGIEERTAATHSVKRRSIDKNGMISSESKEERTYSPLKVFSNQYGMDIAVGGIGERGPNTQVIIGKGEAGHMYMRAEAGDSKHCGSLLIGIEGSAPGADNYLGNEHGITAKSAKQSAFLADKAIVGKKVGGRQVDLSGISAGQLYTILNTFSQKYAELQKSTAPDGHKKLEAVNEMLMGKQMNREAFAEMFGALGINDTRMLDTVDTARKGYFNKKNINVKELTEEDFKQKIRSTYSQEKACGLAEARFEASKDNLQFAAGAVKELMLTHETRGLWWKIRHPILNHRENKTISNLMTRLEENFTNEAIADAFSRYDDTFSMNWGEGLSNDRDAMDFEKLAQFHGEERFKPSEKKMTKIFRAVHEKYYKKLSLTDVAAEEQADMSKELKEYEPEIYAETEMGLPKEPEGLYTQSLVKAKRQQMVVHEEDESKKIKNATSEFVVQNQPIKENEKKI